LRSQHFSCFWTGAPVNPEGGKRTRAAAVTPLIEAGNIHLPQPLCDRAAIYGALPESNDESFR